MQPVRMYTSALCPFCSRAESLLRARGATDIERLRVDLQPELKQVMIEETGRRTVPQIFIGSTHVGGCDDLHALDDAGQLHALLHSEPGQSPSST